MTGFEKYREEVDTFKKSKLYLEKFQDFLQVLRGEQRVPSPMLEQYLDISGAQVREMVKNARRIGIAVGSDQHGYFIAGNHEAFENSIAHMKERAMSILFTLSKMSKCFPDAVELDFLTALDN